MLDVLADLPSALQTERFGRAVREFETCGSTNTEAASWARDGAPEGAVVLSEHQTAGRGRLGRTWADTSGQNLLFSVVLRPSLPPDRLGLITLAGGLAVTDAVAEWAAPVEPRIKWPNDVLLGGRKCCGMLLESSLGAEPFVLLGIGLNVNQDAFPAEIAEHATSLRLETGQLVARELLFAHLLHRLEHWIDRLYGGAHEAVRHAFTERMTGRGEPATIRLRGGDGHALEGIIEGVDTTGALRLRSGDTVHTLHAGDVTLSDRSLAL